MLSVKDLRSAYGRIEVLHGLDFDVSSGEIVCIVGANGAGKTTLLRCLSGVQPITAGSIQFRGEDISKLSAHERVARGLAQAPEGRQIFTNLTVEENIRLGAYRFRDERVAKDMEDAMSMFPMLRQKRHESAASLSGGQQQILAIARALMARPKCLLLDEPSMGLAPVLVEQVFEIIGSLRDLGITTLLIEQNAFGALKISDRGYVMETGRIVISGESEELINSPQVREAYLGI